MRITVGTPSTYTKSKLVAKAPTSLEAGSYYISIYDPKLVASMDIRKYEEEYSLRGVEVLESERGKGYGKELISKALEHLKPKNKLIKLYVDPSNNVAISLYKKMGFQRQKSGFKGDLYLYSPK